MVFLGANDGFPMAGADCCGMPWIAEYARRAREMMRTYARGGRGRVYWLLLPAPRGGLLPRDLPGRERGAAPGGRGLEDDVRLIELDEVFTPGGRYRKLDEDRRQAGAGAPARRRAPEHDRSRAGGAKLVWPALRHDRHAAVRQLDWEGAFNVRDLGGLRDGGRA